MDLEIIGKQMLVTLAFSTMGIVIFIIAFWLMERLSPFSLRKEIEDDHNTAAAIIMASVIIGISLIIMGAMTG
jgi:uncharacterized membrane protein YjfL (UPF0719 family)